MISLGELREAGISAALKPLAARMGVFSVGVREKLVQEELTLKLIAVGGRRGEVLDEVDRRAEVFAEAQRSSTHVRGNPRTSALESVLRDVTEGKL